MHRLALRRFDTLPQILRVLLGLSFGAAASWVTMLLPAYYEAPYVLAFPAVILCAWFMGTAAGIASAAMSGLLIDYWIAFPSSGLALTRPGHLVRLFTFLAVSILMSWIIRLLSKQSEVIGRQEMALELDAARSQRRLAEERARSLQITKDQEIRLRLALAAGRVGLWDLNIATRELTWSDECFTLMGLKPGSVVPTEALWRSLTHSDDLPTFYRLQAGTHSDGKPFSFEHRVVWQDGSIHWLELQAHYAFDEDGVPVRIFGVVTDVTQRREAQASMMRAEKLAVAGQMAASIAHEINNPLEGMANLLFLAANSDELEQARGYIETALWELMRISRITRQTLRFHRQSEHPRRIKISSTLESVLLLCQGKLRSHGILVRQRVVNEPEIDCFASDLEQVLANLMLNAIDSMPQGGQIVVRIKGCCDWRMRMRKGVRLTMADSGHGMDLATRRRIYEPFFTTKPATGTGLGMWVAAEVMDRMQGDLRVWSSQIPGRSGTAFSLFLPLCGDNTSTPAAGNGL